MPGSACKSNALSIFRELVVRFINQGSLNDTFCNHLKHVVFVHRNKGKPPFASCNVQVHNARILVNPSSVLRGLSLLKGVMYFWAHARTPRTRHRYLPVGNIHPPLPLVALMGLRPYSEGWNLRMSAEAVFVLLQGAAAEEILTDLVDVRPGRVDSVSRASQKLSRRAGCHLPLSPKPRVTELPPGVSMTFKNGVMPQN